MSASSLVETHDAQMLDFSHDLDVPMNVAISTENFQEALMEHESLYAEQASVEVDMEEYGGENVEYEMADETIEYHHHGDEPLDVEVYDASHAPSPLPVIQSLEPSVDEFIEPAPSGITPLSIAELASMPGHPLDDQEVHIAPPDQSAFDVPHPEVQPEGDITALDVGKEQVASSDGPSELRPSDGYEQSGVAPATSEQTSATQVDVDAKHEGDGHPHVVSQDERAEQGADLPQHENQEPLASGALSDVVPQAREENVVATASLAEEDANNPLELSEGIYIDPPPAVLLSVTSGHAEFSLFNQPQLEPRSRSPSIEAGRTEPKALPLLLQDRPTLYYEPLSNVFGAFRQDEELLGHIPLSFEGELVLDAYDLQLVVSEDNVHAREISLHDLNLLHDGSDFSGPLRLLLRASVPRFILRYYALQEQIQRLNFAVETGDSEHHDEQQELAAEKQVQAQHHRDELQGQLNVVHTPQPSDEKTVGIQVKPVDRPTTPTALAREEAVTSEDKPVVADETEYHEVAGEEAHVLEEEGDYESLHVGDDYAGTDVEDTLDADRVHDLADTDAVESVTGQEHHFGGEYSDYEDDIQPEEDDERYGEDLEETAGEVRSQLDGSVGRDEGEQDTSTAVDETQVILPGSDDEDEDEGEGEDSTPVVVTELEALSQPGQRSFELPSDNARTNAHADAAAADEIELVNQTNNDILEQGSKHSPHSTSVPSVGTDESDSNFIAMLEREADAEFDRILKSPRGDYEDVGESPEDGDDWAWEDEDAAGEDDRDASLEPDAASNQSSATLSSKVSSKRGHDEVDAEDPVGDPPSSPGPKRPRVG